MTNVQFHIEQAEQFIAMAKRDYNKTHENLAKRDMQAARGHLMEAERIIQDDEVEECNDS